MPQEKSQKQKLNEIFSDSRFNSLTSENQIKVLQGVFPEDFNTISSEQYLDFKTQFQETTPITSPETQTPETVTPTPLEEYDPGTISPTSGIEHLMSRLSSGIRDFAGGQVENLKRANENIDPEATSFAAALAGSMLTKGPAGFLTFPAINQGLRKLQGVQETETAALTDALSSISGLEAVPGGLLDQLGRGATEVALDVTGAGILNKAQKLNRARKASKSRPELSSGISEREPSIFDIEPTTGQAFDSNLIKNVEEIVVPRRLSENISRSNEIAEELISDELDQIISLTSTPIPTGLRTGRTGIDQLSSTIQKRTHNNFIRATEAASARANLVSIGAENTTIVTSRAGSKPLVIDGREINPNDLHPSILESLMESGAFGEDSIIKGPIHLGDITKKVRSILDDLPPETLESGEINYVLGKELNTLLDETQTMVIENGKEVVKTLPISFARAWELKKRFGQLGYGDVVNNVPFVNTKFRDLTSGMDEAIEKSIPQWNNPELLEDYQAAKDIINARHEAFAPLGNRSAGAANVVSGGRRNQGTLRFFNQANDSLDSVLVDAEKMQSFLNSGTIPNVPGIRGNKSELQSYAVMKIMNDSKIMDFAGTKVSEATASFSPTKIQSAWKELTESKAGQLLFGKQERQNLNKTFDIIQQRLNQLSVVNQPLSREGSRYLGLKAITGMITLSGTSASAMLLGSTFNSGLAIGTTLTGGFIAGMYTLGRLAVNPKTARLLHDLLRGAPLQMSQRKASRLISQSLIGVPLSFEGEDGNRISGMVENDGAGAGVFIPNLDQDSAPIFPDGPGINTLGGGVTVDETSLPN